MAHLLHRQLLQFGEGAGEQANQEGCGTADDVNHGGRKDRNEGVLPGEGVEQGHHGMGAAGEGTGRQTDRQAPEPRPSTFGEGELEHPFIGKPPGATKVLMEFRSGCDPADW